MARIHDQLDIHEQMTNRAAQWYAQHPRPEVFERLPEVLLDHLERACEGDWRRCAVNPDGSVDVTNRRCW